MTKTTGDGTSWCILRTAGASTLRLADSLSATGIDAWTPRLIAKRRRPRSREMVERAAPILPTFVFAHADRYADLVRVRSMPVSPHPDFSLFRCAGRVSLVTERQLGQLRHEEALAAEARQRELDRATRLAEQSERRRQLAELRASAPTFAPGDRVRAQHLAFTGMVGTVETGKGKQVMVDFGGGRTFAIEAWLLEPDALHDAQPSLGIAA